MDELLARLRTALGERYTLERELGRGGMATVYLAHDVKLHRRVAIKVLRPELAAALGPDRFLREIEIAAQLTHPHILSLHDSGAAEGLLYYVMPYVDGESLRDRLIREKQLPLEDALQITYEVADALSHAHNLGLVHRDIKPENILFQAGHAVVSDFGIARAISVAGGEKLTDTGIALGTPAYMSPEQGAASGELDARSDIYSLGCVLYEMLAGDPPFTGTNAQGILARKSLEPAPHLRPVRDTVPAQVERMVLKALARVPADRFQGATQFAEALGSTVVVPVPAWQRILRRRGFQVGLGATVLFAAAVLWLWSRSSPRASSSAVSRPKVAVLPFENLGSPEDEWYADGITEEVTSRLAQVSGLGVISRTSAIQYRGTHKALPQIGAELGVQYVIEGTIRSERLPGGARQVRVTPQLIRVSDDTHLWADRYTANMERGGIFTVQADIAEHVAQALDVTLLESERHNLRAQPTQNLEAYDAYLRGNQYAHGGWLIPTDARAAVEMYRRAVTLDPRFAEAHARLSLQYSQMWNGTDDSALALAQRHAERALTLNPNLAWGHLALANYYYTTGDWGRERSELELAEKFGSTSGEILRGTGSLEWGLGDYDRMIVNFHRAFELDPLSADQALTLGVAYFGVRQHAEAERYIDRAIALAPDKPESYMFKAWLYLSWHGNATEARAVLQTAVQRLGPERGFVAGFLSSEWWASRLMATDPWYRSMIDRVSLGPPDLDSVSYYMHKAGFFQGLRQDRNAHTYWDSVVVVVQGRLGRLPPEASRGPVAMVLHAKLGLAYAGLGNKEQAVREARRAAELDQQQKFVGPCTLALTYASFGEHEAAVEQFERVLSVPNWVTAKFLALDPALVPLRQIPRFQGLLERK